MKRQSAYSPHCEYDDGVIREIYDDMTRAVETAEPYQTRLDPPLAVRGLRLQAPNPSAR